MPKTTTIPEAATAFIHIRDKRLKLRHERTAKRKELPCLKKPEERLGRFSCLQDANRESDDELCEHCREMLPIVKAIAEAGEQMSSRLAVLRTAVYRDEHKKQPKAEKDNERQATIF